MMADKVSFKDVKTEPGLLSIPVPKELLGDALVHTAVWLYEDHGIPTPVSGDPLKKNLGEN